MAETSPETRDTQQTRGILAVVVMLLLAGVITILFAAGNLSNRTPESVTDGEKQSPTVTESK